LLFGAELRREGRKGGESVSLRQEQERRIKMGAKEARTGEKEEFVITGLYAMIRNRRKGGERYLDYKESSRKQSCSA